MLSNDYSAIPETTLTSLKQFGDHHVPTGGFLRAVLSDSLSEAFSKADDENRSCLFQIVSFCHWELPSGSYGSREKVIRWLSQDAWWLPWGQTREGL